MGTAAGAAAEPAGERAGGGDRRRDAVDRRQRRRPVSSECRLRGSDGSSVARWRRVRSVPGGRGGRSLQRRSASRSPRASSWTAPPTSSRTVSKGGRAPLPAFLRYRSADDDWEELPFPSGRGDRSIVATDEQVVAFAGSDERGEAPDLVFDPATGDWSELPDDPLPRSFGRTMAWSGRELVLFAHELVPQPGSGEPSLVIAAAPRPRERHVAAAAGLRDPRRRRPLVRARRPADPAGARQRGRRRSRQLGRPYPNGGVLDPVGKWSDLPEPPAEVDPEAGEAFAAGIVA